MEREKNKADGLFFERLNMTEETRPVATEEPTELTPTDNSDAIKTVFHDQKNYNVKHPLQNTWTLWFDNPGKKANTQSWSQNLKEVVNVDTVEDFWG
jgi:translation initiation factor 4E